MNSASPPKLSEILFEVREPSFASMAALPSNVEAIESALLFSTGVHSLLAVVGPSGWGKTHLLGAICGLVSRERESALDRLAVQDFLASPPRTDAHHLVLDDVQEVLGKARQRQALHMILERRVRSARPTVLAFTAPKATRQVRALLPCPRAWSTVAMGEPQPAERILLLSQMGGQEGLSLSPRLIRILALKMHGNGRTYAGALKRLRASGATWLDIDETLRAVGLLDPFFADNAEWDLNLQILRLAEQFRSQLSTAAPLDLALFTMLHKAELAEAGVARAAGISPASAYHRANRFRRLCAGCETTSDAVRKFVEWVVSSLSEES